MSNEISTKVEELMCIVMRNGIKFWIYKKDFEKVSNAILNSDRFVNIEDNLLNVADITGILEKDYIEDIDRIEDRKLKLKERELNLKELTIR